MFVGRRRLARIDRHLDRGDELMESIRDELRLTREMQERNFERMGSEFELTRAELRRQHEQNLRQHELNLREHRATRSAVNSLRDTTRTLVVQVEENTGVLRDVRDEVRAQTACLMRMLDIMGRWGPGEEPAAS